MPEELTWLRRELPRDRWTDLHQTAAFWLEMHAGFRAERASMTAVIAGLRGGGDLREFHDRLLPLLQGHLQHLDGHHRVESGHYFPQFRRAEPRIQTGLDLLDRDHDAVHAQLEAMLNAARAFHLAVRSGRPDARDLAGRLAEAVEAAGVPLLRHLEDEEDLVIPLIQRLGG